MMRCFNDLLSFLLITVNFVVGGFSKVLRHDSIAILRERRKNEPITSKAAACTYVHMYICTCVF